LTPAFSSTDATLQNYHFSVIFLSFTAEYIEIRMDRLRAGLSCNQPGRAIAAIEILRDGSWVMRDFGPKFCEVF
jgi:hypothetical protein